MRFFFQHMNRDQQIVGVGKTVAYRKIGQGLLLTGDPHVMVVPPKYFLHAINVQTISRVQHLLKIALSLTVSEILPFFIFRINRRWPPKFEKRINFFPMGRKFQRNRSISHG